MTLDNVKLDIGSIGFGVQSTGILFAQAFGILPMTDRNYFADLGTESKEVYDYMDYCIPILDKMGVTCNIIKAPNIYEHIMNWKEADRISMIPVYFINKDGKPQPLNRQCTVDFKIMEVAAQIRKDFDMPRLKRWSVRIWQGISLDEIGRTRKTKLFPDEGLTYRINHYPFIEKYAQVTSPEHKWLNYSRQDIIEKIFVANGLKIPPKSSCYICPFHDIYYWYHIYLTQPQEYASAIIMDESIRNYNTPSGKLEAEEFFLYKGCLPLRGLDFEEEIRKDKEKKLKQPELFGCNSGFCMT